MWYYIYCEGMGHCSHVYRTIYIMKAYDAVLIFPTLVLYYSGRLLTQRSVLVRVYRRHSRRGADYRNKLGL